MDLGLGEDLGVSEEFDFGEPSLSADMDLGIDLMSQEEPLIEEPLMEEPIAEEPIAEESVAEEAEFVEPEFAEPEFAEEEETAMPDLSDPHKLMTPDEIAALIAKM